MADIWKKLNLTDQSELVLVNAPHSFEGTVRSLSGTKVVRDFAGVLKVAFVLAFVTEREEIKEFAETIAMKAEGDAVVWFAYPKGSSKRYKCNFSRDSGWEPLGRAGFEAVRQVAIDEDWSALRFRRVEYIKTMTRDRKRAMTAEGKARASND